MQFHRVIGKIDPALVKKAEEALSKVFLDLALRPGNNSIGSSLGGDPLIFSLVYPSQHIATMNIPTAATDGKRFYWNPKFVLSKSKIGMRIVCAHEAWHAMYTHPTRRQGRHPKLWNIAVDFIVNWTVMEYIRTHGLDASAVFKKELGNFVTLENYADHIRNPFVKIKGSEDWVPEPEDPEDEEVVLPKPNEDRELTDKEKEELKKKEAKVKYFFADPNLPEDMRRPERIYDYLLSLIPKCPKCGKIGKYQFPKDLPPQGEEKEKDEKEEKPEEQDDEDKEHEHKHDHDHECDDPSCPCDDDHSSDQSESEGTSPSDTSEPGCCGECGGGYDIFGFGDTLDDHMDADEAPEKMAKRIADAIESAKRMAGSIPEGLQEELDDLMAPKVIWQDFVRVKISKARDGNAKNDWTRFRSRPMFGGLMVPKKINLVCKFGVLLDTSGSMSVKDMTYGISQLQSIDERSEGWIVPADATIYWKDATKLRRVTPSEISQVRVIGRGGTKYAEFFTDYRKEMGEVDFLIVITDGFLIDTDIAEMVAPGVDVIWLITSGSAFDAPFGKVFDLLANS